MSHDEQPFSKWASLWAAVSYALLSVALGIAIADAGLTWSTKALAAGLSAVWALWYWLFVIRSRFWRARTAIQFVSFVVSVAAATGLSWIHTSFVLLLFGYYGIAFGALPLGWAVPISALASVALATRLVDFTQGWRAPRNVFILLGFLATGILNILLGFFVAAIVRQSQERQRMIEELEAAREDLARAERQAGALSERQRLAGEIHDTLAQGFTSVILHLEAAEQNLASSPAQAGSHLSRALRVARESLAEARSVVWALRPDVLEKGPFDAALESMARAWGQASGIQVETAVTGALRPLPGSTEMALFRVAQEALANVRKHARARRASLTLSYMEDQVSLDIQDDGQGFAPAAAGRPDAASPSGGYGISTMRRRVEELGGTLAIESAVGDGTTIAATIPFQGPSVARGDS